MSIGFTFKGKHSSDLGVEIIDYTPPLLPENEGNTESVSGRVGSFYFGPNIGQRNIDLDIQIITDNLTDLTTQSSLIADWLMQTDNEETELVIDDNTNKTYYGRFEGESTLDKLLYNGRATVRFVCSDPYAYYPQEDFELTSGSSIVPVSGSQPTRPIIGAVLKQDITYLAVSNKDDYLYIGEGVDPDTGETPLKPSEVVINDPMNDISRWTSVTTNTLTFDLDYKNGKIDGSFTTTANVIKADDYGVGSQWHGPMSKVVLPQALDNWRIRMRLQNSASAQKQQGKLEIYLVDAQGRRIGLLQVKDNDANTEVNIMKLQIGAQYSTTYPEKNLFNETGTIKKTYKTVKKKKKVKGKWKIVTEKVQTGAYSGTRDFYGYLILEKLGNKFNAQIVKLDSNLQPVWTKKASYTDKNNVYTRALQQLNIYSAAWSTRDPNKIMCFTDLRVEKLNIVANTAPQVIAHAGDEIHFDCETETVYKNGIPFMENLAIGSSWLNLNGGDSETINVSPYDAADWTVSVRPRTF